jgi:signal transduction histidine kinase
VKRHEGVGIVTSGSEEEEDRQYVDDSVASPSSSAYRTVNFQADSALLRELGERLVGQPHIALAELIKNAYDADATYCEVTLEEEEIAVTDNGHGMDESEFLQYWMTIGTRNKQLRGTSRELRRHVTGSKGVGRLSAQFLAHRLELVTSSKNDPSTQLRALVDWDAAIDAGELTQATARFIVEPRDNDFAQGSAWGTRVVMKALKQDWGRDQIKDLGRQLWMIQSPLPQYGLLANNATDANAFNVSMSSWRGDLADAFDQQMAAALENYDAVITGEMTRDGDTTQAHVTVKFRHGDTFSESFQVAGLVDSAHWSIRVFKLQGRQFEGVKVADAREYFERFGGVQVYDAGFRLPYYGVQQDWLGIEYDHSHRRNKSVLLPERLHVKRALNDLPTQGRLFGVVSIDTGKEARNARESEKESGEFLKIQVTRDRLVANRAYEALQNAVRWSLDYYATRERLREENALNLKRPEEASTDKVGRIRELAVQIRSDYRDDDNVIALEREVADLSKNIEEEHRADESARALLGPLASAGMAALALEHESRKEMRLGRNIIRRLRSLSRDLNDDRIAGIADEVSAWIERLENTRKVFAPMLDADDRDQIEGLSLRNVLNQVVENARPLIGGVSVEFEVPRDIILPAATFAEWNSLFQNVLINAANATLDVEPRRVICTAGRTGRSAWAQVSDNGAGIDWQRSSALFEPFAREINISEERRGLGLGGMGLGLTIVRMIADLRHCKVRFIEPEHPWNTTFQLSWSSTQ